MAKQMQKRQKGRKRQKRQEASAVRRPLTAVKAARAVKASKAAKPAKAQPVLRSLSLAVKVGGQWQQAGSCCQAALRQAQGQAQGDYVTEWKKGRTIVATIRRADGAEFQPQMIRVALVSPLLNYAHVVVPDCGRHYVMSRQSFTIRAKLYRVSGQNAGLPFFALADEAGRFLLAFGVVSAAGEVKVHRVTPLISNKNALVGGDDLLTQHVEWAACDTPVKQLQVELFVSQDDPTWFHALRRYTDAIKRREHITYPTNPDAWRPGWCTWTAWCSEKMSEETILANARIAKELGIGTIVLDDGWFGAGLDTDDKVLNLGDYQEDPAKFRDLKGLIRQVQGMGLKVLLWFAALPVARTSQAYERMKPYTMHQDGQEFTSVNGLAMLCPACAEVRKYVADEIERLQRTYNADGFKVDLYNCLPHDLCTRGDHRHDVHDAVQALEKTMAELWQRLIAIKPDALVELKQDYGNVRLLRHGTMVRAGDTAYDSDTNTWRCFYTQAFAPVVHNDYLVTSTLTRPEAMAQLMIRLLSAGVPTFGMDLPRCGEPLRQVIGAWLGLYHRNLAMFQKPREPQNNDFSAWQGGSASLAWVSALRYCREISLPKARRIFLLNGTAQEQLYLKAKDKRKVQAVAYDYRLERLSQRPLTLWDGMRISVPAGGMLEILAR